MKCTIPEISLHNREPVLSVDFQYADGEIRRLATGGNDTHVLIWYVTIGENGTVNLEIACDIRRHIKAVNIVRFSPNGSLLASGDDEAAIWLWTRIDNSPADIFNESEEQDNKEQWTGVRMLRGHIEDVYDLCWSPDGNFLISGSVDNTAIVWDIQKGRSTNILSDHKGFVQGVAWDPEDKFLATLSSDRVCRIYKLDNPKRVHLKVDKAIIPMAGDKSASNPDATPRPIRLFHDDTFKSFCRRLTFTPDGELLIAPSGSLQVENDTIINATYIFHRDSLNKPVVYLPSKDKYTLAVRCCPVLFTLRGKENTQSMFNLPYRVVFAVATQDSVLFYDTQQTNPFGIVSKIHYTGLSDLTWSKDGRILAVSSTDGYCSFITFGENELGMPFTEVLPNFKEKPETKKKKKKNKKVKSAEQVATKVEDVKTQIPVGDSDNKTSKAQPTTSTASTSSIQPEQKRVQLVTLFSPKLKSTIQVFKKNAAGEKQPLMQTKNVDDPSAKAKTLDIPVGTIMEVDKAPNNDPSAKTKTSDIPEDTIIEVDKAPNNYSSTKTKTLDFPEDTIMEVDKAPNDDPSAKTKTSDIPEDTIIEVDKAPNNPDPSVLITEETFHLKLELSDSETEITSPKQISNEGGTSRLAINTALFPVKTTDDRKAENKMEIEPSDENLNVEISVTKDAASESDKPLESVVNELPTLQENSTTGTPPRQSSSSSQQRGQGTPPSSGVRTPRRVQLITLSAKNKPISSENERKVP